MKATEVEQPEGYDERAGSGIAHRYRLRRHGWRKDPTGHGYVCPVCACKTSGSIHDRSWHDSWHNAIIQRDEELDSMWDQHHGEHVELENAIRHLSGQVEDLHAICQTLTTILAAERVRRQGESEPVGA